MRCYDETGVNLAMTRRYRRIIGGERVNDERPGNKGKNISLVGAISDVGEAARRVGLIATMTLPGGFNTAIFLVYIEQILLPVLWVGAIVVMDNVPFHHADKIESLIESVGAKVKYLPPYSPDLSPIELCWSKIKEILRSAKARTENALNIAITNAINAISDEDAINWFNHCGLFAESIRLLLSGFYLVANCCNFTYLKTNLKNFQCWEISLIDF